MARIDLLDCTLRDGGYINDWDFGHSVITGTYRRLDAAGVDYIEVGFLDDRRPMRLDSSIQPTTQAFDDLFNGVKKRHAEAVAMIDYGTCGIENVSLCAKSFLDCIRVIFKKDKIDQALPFCQMIKEKGYKLFIQAVSITSYSDEEIVDYVQRVNQVKPFAFSIVDTYGLLGNLELAHYFDLIDKYLSPGIKIGYHAHNNFQLGFSNAIQFLSFSSRHDLIVDSTVYGMGKSAGNCPSELLALHMNGFLKKSYDLNQLLEIIDTDLMQIFQKSYWGYRYDFYISAMHRCHPNYVKYLVERKTLSITSINEILSRIPTEKKLLYDKAWIENAYVEYQSICVDDHLAIQDLAKMFLNRKKWLILGPGRSLITERDDILRVIDKDTLVISVNFRPESYPIDCVFISNGKRYSKLADILGGQPIEPVLILTSNITPLECYRPDYRVNYESLFDKNLENGDSSLFLILGLFLKLGVDSVMLAGFDGFSGADVDYCDRSYSFERRNHLEINTSVANDLKRVSNKITLKFITNTKYTI